jgi:hypothetical protein
MTMCTILNAAPSHAFDRNPSGCGQLAADLLRGVAGFTMPMTAEAEDALSATQVGPCHRMGNGHRSPLGRFSQRSVTPLDGCLIPQTFRTAINETLRKTRKGTPTASHNISENTAFALGVITSDSVVLGHPPGVLSPRAAI